MLFDLNAQAPYSLVPQLESITISVDDHLWSVTLSTCSALYPVVVVLTPLTLPSSFHPEAIAINLECKFLPLANVTPITFHLVAVVFISTIFPPEIVDRILTTATIFDFELLPLLEVISVALH